MGSRRSGRFSERDDLLRVRSQLPWQVVEAEAQRRRDAEELNNLVRRKQPQRSVAEEVGEDWAEDGFPQDDNDPLVYVSPDSELADSEQCQVKHQRIALRRQPSLDSKVLGVAYADDVFDTYGLDPTQQWRKIHHVLRGSKVEAWMLVKHPDIGELVQPVSVKKAEEETEKNAQPTTPENPVPVGLPELEVAYKELEDLIQRTKQENADPSLPVISVEGHVYATLEDLDQAIEHGGLQYQVVHKPNVRIRSGPSTQGKIVGSLDYGSYFDTFGWDERKKWRKMFCRCPDRRIIVSWIFTTHPELGALIESAAG